MTCSLPESTQQAFPDMPTEASFLAHFLRFTDALVNGEDLFTDKGDKGGNVEIILSRGWSAQEITLRKARKEMKEKPVGRAHGGAGVGNLFRDESENPKSTKKGSIDSYAKHLLS